MQFKTHYGNTPSLGEINTAPSQTIPNQSFSVREIMTRYAQNLGWNGPKIPVYDNGEDPLGGIDLERLDLTERAEILEQVTERIKVLRHEMAEAQKPKRLKAPQATIETSTETKQPAPVEDNNLE